MKDLFIDNNIAKNFTNPLDPEYKKLITWLKYYDEKDPTNDAYAYLVVSNKLIREYLASAQNAHTNTSIPALIDLLTRQGRKIHITNDQIKNFQGEYFTKKIAKRLRSNNEDRNHIPLVLLSTRKYALAIDNDFVYDLEHFPGFTVLVAKRPENLPYEK